MRVQPSKAKDWHFDFGLAPQQALQTIPYSDAEELMEVIISWAEGKGYGVGGGFRPFDESDPSPFCEVPEGS